MLWILTLLLACGRTDEQGASPPPVTPTPQVPEAAAQVESAAAPEGPVSEPALDAPAFEGHHGPLPDALVAKMTGVSLHEGCPVGRDALALLEVTHWTLEGEVASGRLVVAKEVAAPLQSVFERLFEAKFAIERMEPVHHYGGSDDASMAANNTSAFNCRRITGGKSWSEHSYGRAIDINPLRNPYVRGSRVLPKEGEAYVERDGSVPGVIVDGDAVVTAFAAVGWKWGGHWTKLKDYQHFSESGK